MGSHINFEDCLVPFFKNVSLEEVPSPTAEEIGKKAAKKVMMLCRKGDWNAAGEVLKVIIIFLKRNYIFGSCRILRQ